MTNFELLSTEGYALQAQFRLKQKEYGAMDDFSAFPPSVVDLGSPVFDILCVADQNWNEMFQGNPDEKQELVATGDWSYDGYGKIVSISPVVIDFGDFSFEIGDFTSDVRCVGEFVYIVIDRLDLSFQCQ